VDGAQHRRAFTTLECERLDFAGGQGMCLAARRGFATTYRAYSFGTDLRLRHEFPLSGIPSRTRVSPDGRVAAVTVFVSGHSYTQGGFSTETMLFDLRTGTTLSEMEEFTVLRGGERFTSPDFNFWGVTFAADGNRFYATLASRGTTYLIEGDLPQDGYGPARERGVSVAVVGRKTAGVQEAGRRRRGAGVVAAAPA